MRNLYKYCLIILFVIAAFAGQGYCSAAEEIEPGWRVGYIIMTMTMDEVQAILGTGECSANTCAYSKSGISMIKYKTLGLEFVFNKDVIEEIYVYYPSFQIKGIKVGSSVNEVEKILGNHYSREEFQHTGEPDIPDYKMRYSGIHFYIKGNRVAYICVKNMHKARE